MGGRLITSIVPDFPPTCDQLSIFQGKISLIWFWVSPRRKGLLTPTTNAIVSFTMGTATKFWACS